MTRICLFVGLILALVGSTSANASPSGAMAPQSQSEVKGIPTASYFFPGSNSSSRLDYPEIPVETVAEMAAAYKSPVTGATVYGLVKQGNKYNIVSANVEAQSNLTVKKEMQTGGPTYTAAVYINGRYHVMSEYYGVIFPVEIYDVTNWNQVNSASYKAALYAVSMTYNEADGKVYGCFTNAGATAYDFATLDLETGAKSVIAALPQRFVAISADAAGEMYGIAVDGKLYKIATDGTVTEVGATGVTPDTSVQDACFDVENGQLYWATGNSIYVVDTATGAAEKVTVINGQVTEWFGLFTRSDASGGAPSWVDDLTVTFNRDALTGNISFKMPVKDTAGADLSGPLKYYITEGDEIASGEADAGAPVNEVVTVAEGSHEFKVYASNKGTDGMSSLRRMFVGHDTPVAPANLSVEDGGIDNIVLKWDAVTAGVNSGYINLDGIKYKVVRQPGNVVVADALSATTVVDATVPSMAYYSYEVSASDGVKTSAVTVSDRVLLGSDVGIIPPYKYTFDEEGGFGLFTENDANGDGYKWAYSEDPAMLWYVVNPSVDSDDWLISPPVKVESGKNYNLQIDLVGSSRYETERIEIRYGLSPEPADMTGVIMAPSDFRVYNDIDRWFVPEVSGKIYVGLHVVTPAVEGAIRIDRFEMSAGFASESPDTVTGAKVVAAPMGGMSAEISFTCPEKTFMGNALQEITKVTVKNNTTGKVLELTDAAPSKNMRVTDASPASGQNDYTIVCHNAQGSGRNVDLSVWVGMDLPGLPRNVIWRQTGDNTVSLSWDAPEGGQHGGYVDISSLKYHVVIPEPFQVIKTDYDKKEINLNLQLSQKQDVLSFGVAGVNEKGIGVAMRSNQSAYGEPLETPFYESFEGANLHSNPWLVKQVEGNNSCYVLNYVPGVEYMPYDDNGMVAFTTTSIGSTRLELPMLDISRMEAPALKMWCCFIGSLGRITVRGNNNSGTEWVDIQSVPAKRGWHLVSVPLDKFKGEKRAQIGIEMSVDKDPTMSTLSYVLVDKLSVVDNPDFDLMLSDISVPDQAKAGAPFKTTVQVTNAGAKAVDNYTVDITVNGDLAVSKPCGRIEPDEMVSVEVDVPLSPNATTLEILASVVCSGDANMDNNDRGVSGVRVVRSRYPQPSNLHNASDNANRIDLAWTAPVTRYIAPVMDNMEAYTNGDIGGIDVKRNSDNTGVVVTNTVGAIGPYKLVDNDRQATAFVQLAWGRLPDLGNGMVCQVVDVVETGFTSVSTIWAGHSGNKVLCFWSALGLGNGVQDVRNDDYLILPKLAEDDPHISLWAKSITDRYGLETFDVMVSMDGNDVEDFQSYQSVTNIPAGYASAADAGFTFYEFDLPEGTQYAAIRYNAAGTMALLIDDITYTPEANYQDVTLLGYNVYRNNVKINDRLLTEPEFTDAPDRDGNYIYNVTAVFAEGESRFSNSVRINGYTSDIDYVEADDMQAIRVDGRDIVIAGFAGEQASVYTPDGRMVVMLTAEEDTKVPVAPGIYIVKVGDKAKSVAVR